MCTFIRQHSVPVSKYLRELSCTRKGLFGAQVSIDPVQDQLLLGKGASPLARVTYCNVHETGKQGDHQDLTIPLKGTPPELPNRFTPPMCQSGDHV